VGHVCRVALFRLALLYRRTALQVEVLL
jgi:hypothetical protein